MFEKEAEEYQIKKHHQRLYGHKPVVMKELNTTFKDGAEFGYNKALEEQGDKIESAYREGVAFGKDKLKDEWHYVSKEGHPTKDDIYLIIRKDGLHLGDYCCGGDGDIDCQSWCDYPSEEEIQDDSIIAWKEIVPPKESE